MILPDGAIKEGYFENNIYIGVISKESLMDLSSEGNRWRAVSSIKDKKTSLEKIKEEERRNGEALEEEKVEITKDSLKEKYKNINLRGS